MGYWDSVDFSKMVVEGSFIFIMESEEVVLESGSVLVLIEIVYFDK